MTVEADLTALLKAVCPRVTPDFETAIPECPYIIYTQIGGQAATFLDGSLPSKENGEFQIDVWSKNRAQAKAMIKQIEVLLSGTQTFIARAVSAPRSDSDPDMKVYCSRQDWSIWSDR